MVSLLRIGTTRNQPYTDSMIGKNKDLKLAIRLLITSLLWFGHWNVQSQTRAVLSGVVMNQKKLPLANVSVVMISTGDAAITDNSGRFVFENPGSGELEITFSSVGYATKRVTCTKSPDTALTIILEDRIVGLKDVIVTARPRLLGSSSTIDKSAIIHTQPTSLSDVLQLVPGQLATNPNLGSAAQINLRQIPTTSDAGRANALGTQIVLDGVPFSNNANLQTDVTILNASPGALPPFSSVAGRGNDLRQIPADNIESIEVIRGIPSARYGDLTAGLIIVHSRIGRLKPEAKVRLNPNMSQFALLGGFSDKRKMNAVNIGFDMLHAREDVRDKLNGYSRIQGQATWQKFWDDRKKFVTTTILSAFNTIDNLKRDPTDMRYQTERFADEYNVRASTEGKWKADRKWLSSVSYIAALNVNRQKGFYQGLVTRDLFPISTSYIDTTMTGVFGKSEYLNKTTVDGRPVNAYSRIEATLFKRIFNATHNFIVGAEWRMDRNHGEGRQFDLLTPPRQNYSVGERPSSFKEIPALHQLAWYAEEKLSGLIGMQRFILQAGVRIDNVSPVGVFKSKYKTIASPRINFAVEINQNIWFRGGYGIASKAVPLNHLYPGKRYFDLVNFNYFANNPSERLTVITTRSINLNDRRLNPYTSEKFEFGFDVKRNGLFANISIFHEKTSNAIGINREVMPFAYSKLKIESAPSGQPPVLSALPASIDTFFAAYDAPVNSRTVNNKGVEYSIDLPEINAIRTSFNITGAFIQTKSDDNGMYTDADKAYAGTVAPKRVGVYPSSGSVTAKRMNTSLRFVHRIPSHNIVFSALWQAIWITQNRREPLSVYAMAYINRKGEMIEINEQERKSEEFSDLKRPVNQANNTSFPPLHLINIRLTKEWKKGFGFSFYVNNFINLRPLHTNPDSNGFVRRNEPMFFGAEFNVSF